MKITKWMVYDTDHECTTFYFNKLRKAEEKFNELKKKNKYYKDGLILAAVMQSIGRGQPTE